MNTNYIISVKEKTSGRDVFPPFVVPNIEKNMDEFVYQATANGCVVIIDKIDIMPIVPDNLFTKLTSDGKEK